MKFKVKEFTKEENFLSHLILDCLNDAALETVKDNNKRDGDTIVDIELKFNGVEIDIRRFTKHLEEAWDSEIIKATKPEANKLFEKMEHEFKSKKSTNAQLNKIRVQLQNANNQLKNISENVEKL